MTDAAGTPALSPTTKTMLLFSSFDEASATDSVQRALIATGARGAPVAHIDASLDFHLKRDGVTSVTHTTHDLTHLPAYRAAVRALIALLHEVEVLADQRKDHTS